jgi:predicted ATP-grasp superfamily ATP-dependent carboligase
VNNSYSLANLGIEVTKVTWPPVTYHISTSELKKEAKTITSDLKKNAGKSKNGA